MDKYVYEMNGVRGKLMSNDRGSHVMLVELEYRSASALYQENFGKCFVHVYSHILLRYQVVAISKRLNECPIYSADGVNS